MPPTTTISPIEQFREAFIPFGKINRGNEIIYPFKDVSMAQRAHDKAVALILEKGFAVTASVGDYCLNGTWRIGLIIRPVPEEHIVADEVPGEVMEPDWWGSGRRDDE